MDYKSPDTAPVLGSPPDAKNLTLYKTDEDHYYWTALTPKDILKAFFSRPKGSSRFEVGPPGYKIKCSCSCNFTQLMKIGRCPSLLDIRLGSQTNGRWARVYDPDEDKQKETKRAKRLAKTWD